MIAIPSFLAKIAREPAYSAGFVITLALGVGVNAALLSALLGYYFSPLPYREPNRLVIIEQQLIGQEGVSSPAYHDLLTHAPRLKAVGLARIGQATIIIGGHPRVVSAVYVTPSFFSALAATPKLGHVFDAAAGKPQGPLEVVLSYTFWKDAYGGDRQVVGQTISIEGTPYAIMGVMPAGFYFPYQNTQIYLPLVVNPGDRDYMNMFSGYIIGRLAPRTGNPPIFSGSQK